MLAMKFILSVLLFSVLLQVQAVTDANPGNNQTVCVGSSFSIQGNSPNNGEESYWIDIDGFIESPGDTIWSTEIEQPFPGVGEYNFSYEIRDDVDTSKANLFIEVLDIPVLVGPLVFQDGCEGEAVQATIPVSSTATEYIWSASNGETVNILTPTTVDVILPTDGSMSVEISVKAENECGESNSVVGSNTISFKPKDVPVIETISGNDWVCETKEESFQASSTDATSFTWKWLNNVKLAEAPIVDVLTLTSVDFSEVTSGAVEVVAVNSCGEGVSGFKVLSVVAPEIIDVDITADKNNNEFCIEEDVVVFTAFSASGEMGGLIPYYRFFIGSQEIQSASSVSSYMSSVGELTDGSTIGVEIIADARGCYTSTTAEAFITMKGYSQPSVLLVSNNDALCESSGDITLTVEGLQKGDEVSSWMLEGEVLVGYTANDYTASSALDRGVYEVEVVNEFCSASAVASTSIMIYEQPKIDPFSFLTTENTLILEFDEFENPISEIKEVTVSGLVEDEGLTDSYLWKSSSSDLTIQSGRDFDFNAKKGIEDSVTFIVSNGVGDGTCVDSAKFYIKDADAVGLHDIQIVNNALYPNPVVQGTAVFLNSVYAGAKVEVYAIDGTKVFNEKMKDSLLLTNMDTGIYVVRIKKEGQVFVSKLIVE